MKIDDERKEQSSSVAQTLGIKRNVEELQEKEEQPLPDCQWDGKEDKERRIKKKKVRRKEGQILTENEEGKKKKTRMITRKRSRSKGRCELTEEREEKVVKNQKEIES